MSNEEEASMAQTTQPKCTSVGIQPPTGLDLSTKKKKDNWRIYKQQWNNYCVIAELEKQSEEYKIAMFLYSIGPDAVRVYNAFDMTDDQRKSLKSIVEAFDITRMVRRMKLMSGIDSMVETKRRTKPLTNTSLKCDRWHRRVGFVIV